LLHSNRCDRPQKLISDVENLRVTLLLDSLNAFSDFDHGQPFGEPRS
jgi:hypothetical protein